MKRFLFILAAALTLTLSATAREFAVSGSQGGLSMKVSLPKGFDPERDNCHMVILMHGIFASMTAGDGSIDPESLILIAPGSVIKDACQEGHFFGNSIDPKYPPEYIKCFSHFKLGRNYMLQTQELDIYGVSANFQSPVCIIHGSQDGTVPM